MPADPTLDEAERRMLRATRAGCNAADIHLRCSYPECGCTKTPIIVRAALALADTDGWREIDDHAKNGDDVLLGRRTDTFVVLACWDEDEQGHPGFPWVAPEGCRYPIAAFDMYAPVPVFPLSAQPAHTQP